MTLSICSICQDEADIIQYFLNCCVFIYQRLPQDLKEVILIDGGSKDNTIEIIKSYQDKLPLTLIKYPFDTFGQQKNRALEKATGDYILGLDSDMTISKNFVEVFQSNHFSRSAFWDFPMYFTVRDSYHFFHKWPRGVNMRLWKRGPLFVKFFHERLKGQPSSCTVCNNVYVFEHSMRASDEALLNRGQRYQKFWQQMQDAGGNPGPVDRYVNSKHCSDSEIGEFGTDIKTQIIEGT